MKIKLLLLIIIIAAFTNNLHAQNQSYFLRDYYPNFGLEVKGEVKTIKETNSGGFYGGIKLMSFNADGNLLEIKSLSSKGVPSKSGGTSIIYSEDGFINSKIVGKDTMHYSHTELSLIKTIAYPSKTYSFTYDESGQLDSLYITDSDRNDISQVKWTYNANGQFIKEQVFENGQEVSHLAYELDDQGNRISTSNSNQLKVNEYDEFGNAIRSQDKMTDGKVNSTTEYAYKYDAQGNWVEKIVTKNGRQIKKSVRAIEYW